MSSARNARIADQIQRELAELIRDELRDPRVHMVTLTGVELSRDQSHAKVFFTVLGTAAQAQACGEGLSRSAGFLRAGLAHRLTTRKVPELHFAFDESVERGVRLSRLIDEAVAGQAVAPAPGAAPKLEPKPKPKPKPKQRATGAVVAAPRIRRKAAP